MILLLFFTCRFVHAKDKIETKDKIKFNDTGVLKNLKLLNFIEKHIKYKIIDLMNLSNILIYD